MNNPTLDTAMESLGEPFAKRNWNYLDVPAGSPVEKSYAWSGPPKENIMICVHKGSDIHEMFHRQDFFFFNFAYSGDYGALSYQYDNHITIRENECYIGQPFAGYALYAHSEQEIIIIGILIQKEAFFLPSQLYFHTSAQRNREVFFRNSSGTSDGPGGQFAEKH